MGIVDAYRQLQLNIFSAITKHHVLHHPCLYHQTLHRHCMYHQTLHRHCMYHQTLHHHCMYMSIHTKVSTNELMSKSYHCKFEITYTAL